MENIAKNEHDTVPNDDAAEKFAREIIKRAASLKMVKIDRSVFLRTELNKHCPHIDAELAIESTPALAGVSANEIDKIAKATIDFETKKCASLSFIAGIPGGVAVAGTVPADLAQYFAHVMRIEQKLAYLYGWQSFLDKNDEIDDQTVMELVILMGVMLEVAGAANALTQFAKTAGKVVLIIGGAISGGMTYASFKPSAERLRRYLRSLPTSGIADA